MVNKANIDLMIERISAEKEPIEMGDFVDHSSACGTTACLAGWANLIRLKMVGRVPRDSAEISTFWETDKAAEWMGITEAQAQRLFFQGGIDDLPHEQRKEKAIELLKTLRDTGDAHWSVW